MPTSSTRSISKVSPPGEDLEGASSTCHIYIYGDIVNIQAPNLGKSGAVSLTSVKDAYTSNSACDQIVVHIHSNGGSVFEGFAIYDFLVNTRKPVTTVVEGLCCSIATVIFLAGTERKLTENSRFLIHNPWGNAEGDAEYFRQYANELQNEQARLLTFYKQHTGASTQILQNYMDAEKLMSPQLALDLKFATGIIDASKAMAMYRNHLNNPYTNQSLTNYSQPTLPANTLSFGEGRVRPNNNNMDKTKKSRFNQLIAGLKNLVSDFNNEGSAHVAANKTLAGDAGDLYFDGELAEGTAIFSDDAMTVPAADGDYEFADGTSLTVASGLATDVAQSSSTTSTNDEPANKAVLASLRKEVSALKAEKVELEKALTDSETVMNSASKALQMAKSTYRPEKRENKFNHASSAGPAAASSDLTEKNESPPPGTKNPKSQGITNSNSPFAAQFHFRGRFRGGGSHQPTFPHCSLSLPASWRGKIRGGCYSILQSFSPSIIKQCLQQLIYKQ